MAAWMMFLFLVGFLNLKFAIVSVEGVLSAVVCGQLCMCVFFLVCECLCFITSSSEQV